MQNKYAENAPQTVRKQSANDIEWTFLPTSGEVIEVCAEDAGYYEQAPKRRSINYKRIGVGVMVIVGIIPVIALIAFAIMSIIDFVIWFSSWEYSIPVSLAAGSVIGCVILFGFGRVIKALFVVAIPVTIILGIVKGLSALIATTWFYPALGICAIAVVVVVLLSSMRSNINESVDFDDWQKPSSGNIIANIVIDAADKAGDVIANINIKK